MIKLWDFKDFYFVHIWIFQTFSKILVEFESEGGIK